MERWIVRIAVVVVLPFLCAAGEVTVVVDVEGWIVRGKPAVPVRAVWVGLPQNANEETVTVKAEAVSVRWGYVGAPQVMRCGSKIEKASWQAGTDGLYPAAWAELVNVGRVGVVKVALVRVFGARVDATGYGMLAESVRLHLCFEDGDAEEGAPPHLLPRLANPDVVRNYRFVNAAGSVDVVVIAPKAIIDAGALNDWLKHRKAQGFAVEVASIESIDAAYGGCELAEKIRAHLKAKHSQGAFCALLVGTPDPDDNTDPRDSVGSVPMKMCWPRKYESPNNSLSNPNLYRQAPTDFYYADLTGNWDKDGDGFYGEGYIHKGTEDGDLDGIDFLAEMMVGRIPFDNPNEVREYLQRVIDYEQAGYGYDFGSGGRLHWRHRALIGCGDYLDASTPPHGFGEYLRKSVFEPQEWTTRRSYRTGDVTLRDFYCNPSDFASEWSNGYGIVAWLTHGQERSADDVFDTFHCYLLPQNKGAFVVAAACKNGTPEDPYALYAEALRHGVLAFYGFSRVMWYAPAWGQLKDGGGISLCAMLLKHILQGEFAGQALANSVWWFIQEGGGFPSDIYNVFSLNLYGDPLLRVMWLDIMPLNLSEARKGRYYSQQLHLIGGYIPASFSIVGGALPPGLWLCQDGLIEGTPFHSGSWSFVVQVKDCTGAVSSRRYSLKVRRIASGCLYTKTSDGTGLWALVVLFVLLSVRRRWRCSSTASITT